MSRQHPYRMSGSTPTGRSKSYPYYITLAKPNGKQRHVSCATVDDQLPDLLREISVNPALLPRIRELYQLHLERLRGPTADQLLADAQALIARMRTEEAALARLYAQGKLTDESYDLLHGEWKTKLFQAEQELNRIQRGTDETKDDLEFALKLLRHMHQLFGRFDRKQQARLLQILFARIIIDTQGNILEYELNSPFTYLSQLEQEVRRESSSTQAQGGSSHFHLSPP